MPQSSSYDSPINRLRGGIVVASLSSGCVCVCRGVGKWRRLLHPCGKGVYAYTCVCVCVCVCVCRLEELWRVGFMSQQVTDDQIN